MELVKVVRDPLNIGFETADNCRARLSQIKEATKPERHIARGQPVGVTYVDEKPSELRKRNRAPYVPPPNPYITKPKFEDYISYVVGTVWLCFMLFAPLDVYRMSTLGIGILIVAAIVMWDLAESTKGCLYVITGSLTTLVLSYFFLSPGHFALMVLWLILVPIGVIAFSIFTSVVNTPLASLTIIDGYWGYIAGHVIYLIFGALLMSWLGANGEFVRALLEKVFLFIHWDWVAYLFAV